MKFFTKTEDGRLVEATAEQYCSTDVTLYNGEGEKSDRKSTTKDPVQELQGVVTELMGSVTDMKKAHDSAQEKLAAYEEAARRGFPIGIPVSESQENSKYFWGYELARQGKRLMDKSHFTGHVIEDNAKREEMAKFFILWFKSNHGDPVDRIKAYSHLRDMFPPSDFQKTAVGDSGNVFPVPDIVEEEIFAFAREQSVALQNARIWEMTSEKQSFPQETGSASVSWGNTTGNSDPTISEVELTAEELSAYTVVKNMTLADSRSDIVSWLTSNMAEAAGQELDNVMFNGDGTSDYASCSGILSAACGYSTVMSSGSTAFSSLDATVLSEMISKLDGLKKQGARFWTNGVNLHHVRSLKDAQDRPIFMETVGAPVSGTIWGYPYSEVIKMPSTSAANTAFIAFGNARYFAIGRRLGSTALQVDPYGLWTTNRTRYKIYQRYALSISMANGWVRCLTASS